MTIFFENYLINQKFWGRTRKLGIICQAMDRTGAYGWAQQDVVYGMRTLMSGCLVSREYWLPA